MTFLERWLTTDDNCRKHRRSWMSTLIKICVNTQFASFKVCYKKKYSGLFFTRKFIVIQVQNNTLEKKKTSYSLPNNGRIKIEKISENSAQCKEGVPDTVFYFSSLACLNELCVNLIGSTDWLC